MKNIYFKNFIKALLNIFLYMLVIPQLIALIIFQFIDINNLNNIAIINILVYLINIIIIFIIHNKSIKSEWHLYLKNFKSYIKIAFKNWGKGLLLMMLLNIIVINLVGSLASNEVQNRDILQQLPIFSIFTMVFMGPILEEFLFRKNFKEAFKNKKLFLIITSLLFGLAHVISNLDYSSLQALLGSSKELLYILPYGSLGYFFGKAYYETDCIFTSITAHMFHNGLSIMLILLSSLLV